MTLLHPALYHYLFTQGLIAPLSLKNKKKNKKHTHEFQTARQFIPVLFSRKNIERATRTKPKRALTAYWIERKIKLRRDIKTWRPNDAPLRRRFNPSPKNTSCTPSSLSLSLSLCSRELSLYTYMVHYCILELCSLQYSPGAGYASRVQCRWMVENHVDLCILTSWTQICCSASSKITKNCLNLGLNNLKMFLS